MTRNRSGFALGEVIIAVLVMSACLVPILLLMSSTRVDTSRAVHRLRAMELINEATDWLTICPYGNLSAFAGFASGDIIPIPIVDGRNKCLKAFISSGKTGEDYSSDYKDLIERTVSIDAPTGVNKPFRLGKIHVSWTESGKKYKYGMGVVVIDETYPDY